MHNGFNPLKDSIENIKKNKSAALVHLRYERMHNSIYYPDNLDEPPVRVGDYVRFSSEEEEENEKEDQPR